MIKHKLSELMRAPNPATRVKLIIDKVDKKRDLEVYNEIANFIPAHTLVGKGDLIPGVVNIFGKGLQTHIGGSNSSSHGCEIRYRDQSWYCERDREGHDLSAQPADRSG